MRVWGLVHSREEIQSLLILYANAFHLGTDGILRNLGIYLKMNSDAHPNWKGTRETFTTFSINIKEISFLNAISSSISFLVLCWITCFNSVSAIAKQDMWFSSHGAIDYLHYTHRYMISVFHRRSLDEFMELLACGRLWLDKPHLCIIIIPKILLVEATIWCICIPTTSNVLLSWDGVEWGMGAFCYASDGENEPRHPNHHRHILNLHDFEVPFYDLALSLAVRKS